MTPSVNDPFAVLDRVDAPDLWTAIVERGGAESSDGHDLGSRDEWDLAFVDPEPNSRAKREDMKRTTWIGLLGVAAASILAIVGLVAVNRSDVEPNENTPATNPSVPTETLPQPIGTDVAMQVTDAYFDAYNSGDADALFSMFAQDATFPQVGVGPMKRSDWENLIAWNLAQGTSLTERTCDAIDEFGSVRVTCSYDNADALVQAVDSQPVPMVLNLLITADGIHEFNRTFTSADFLAVGVPFDRWMMDNHPEDADQVVCCFWSSFDEAEQNGQLVAQYAAEWAASLKANGCKNVRFGICR